MARCGSAAGWRARMYGRRGCGHGGSGSWDGGRGGGLDGSSAGTRGRVTGTGPARTGGGGRWAGGAGGDGRTARGPMTTLGPVPRKSKFGGRTGGPRGHGGGRSPGG